jgi:hypothetical protein
MPRFPFTSCLLLVLPAALPAQQAERYTLDAGPVAVYNLVGGQDHMVGTIGDGKGTIAIATASGGIKLLKNSN